MAETINSHLKHGLLQVHTDCTSGHQSPAVVTGGCTCVIAFLYFSPASVCGWVALTGCLHVTSA